MYPLIFKEYPAHHVLRDYHSSVPREAVTITAGMNYLPLTEAINPSFTL